MNASPHCPFCAETKAERDMWKADVARLRLALLKVGECLGDSDDPDPPMAIIHEALRTTSAQSGVGDG